MTSDKDEEYWLATNSHASARLNLQHLWNQLSCGYLIHPSISVPPNAKIADIGTGTGIWPISLSLTLPPTVQLDGFDISSNQYPPREWLPNNVALQEWNVLDPGGVPQHMAGAYDLVNVRYFGIVVRRDNFETLLKNLVGLLKPGGYLQWTEVNIADQAVISTTSAGSATSSFSDNGKRAIAAMGVDFDWLRNLADIFETKGGLTQVLQVRPPPVPALRSMSSYLALGGWEEFSYNVLDARGGPPHPILGTGEELRGRTREVRREVEGGGAAIEQVHFVTVGRRPV